MRHLATGLSLVLALAIIGCGSSRDKEIQRILDSPISYKSHLSAWANMENYRTWHWVPIPQATRVDPRASDPKLRDEIEKAVTKHMVERGYTKVDGSPDLQVNYHVTTQDVDRDFMKTMYDGKYWPAYRMDFRGSGKAAREWKEGSVLIFIFDAQSQEIVWQSSAMAEIIDEAPEEGSAARLNEAIKVMFVSLPGRPAWQMNE
jgi:hypothetical protein